MKIGTLKVGSKPKKKSTRKKPAPKSPAAEKLEKKPSPGGKTAEKLKHPGGRPTKYKPEYCDRLIAFFDVEPFREDEIEHLRKDGDVSYVELKRFANRLPTLRRFAREIGVSWRTVYNWKETKEEFLHALEEAEQIRQDFVNENGLNGIYNSAYAKFWAINMTKMRDRVETEVTGNVRLTYGHRS